jgi:Holliday junction resolvase RusA-like endonuclease
MADMSIILPLPPSTNRMWRIMRGRAVKSADYRAWKDGAALSIARQIAGDGPLMHFTVAILMPPTRRDPDNSVKPFLDALQAGGAIQDDKRLRCLVLTVDDTRDPETALIELRHAAAPPPKPKNRRASTNKRAI